MKKNQNILNYVEKYKQKNHIVYTDEKSKFFKIVKVLALVSLVYSLVVLLLWILSFSVNFSVGKLTFSKLKTEFIITIVSTVMLIGSVVLLKLKRYIPAYITAIVIETVIVFMYKSLSSINGMGYISSFYWAFLVPAILVSLFSLILLAIIFYSKHRKNRLYSEIIDILYRQHGKKDGVKLSDAEWEEFLNNYNIDNKEGK